MLIKNKYKNKKINDVNVISFNRWNICMCLYILFIFKDALYLSNTYSVSFVLSFQFLF